MSRTQFYDYSERYSPYPLGLVDTEGAHKEALIELHRMRETMERMEQERAEMVAEVEAQIERALASMAVDVDESDYGGEITSRPASRMSNSARSAGGTRSRQPSDPMKTTSDENGGARLRSIGTESTLAESYGGMDDTLVHIKSDRETSTITEEEEISVSPARKKRFSATQEEIIQDGMMAVDEGISERSDRIAQKVLQIQHKVSSVAHLYNRHYSIEMPAGECFGFRAYPGLEEQVSWSPRAGIWLRY